VVIQRKERLFMSPNHTLRSLADQRQFLIGAAVAAQPLRSVAAYAETLAREFNIVTPENVMKMESLQPERGVFNFTEGDHLVGFAEAHRMKVRGHTLVWHNQLPSWLAAGEFDSDTLRAILREHIMTVAQHYRGRISAWDVVNEAITDERNMRDTVWLRGLGENYIADAFRWAHDADPAARLFYNDYNAECLNPKSDAVYALVADLVRQGVPIHGVGLQMHIGIDKPPSPADVAANIARLNVLGLQVQITEMDVKIQKGTGDEAKRFKEQAQVYRDMLTVCLQAENCTGFVLWGFTDLYSWIPGFTGHDDAALIFDKQYQPKPAYHALIRAFSEKFG
jgi:endo-1,4-beta-xylanase